MQKLQIHKLQVKSQSEMLSNFYSVWILTLTMGVMSVVFACNTNSNFQAPVIVTGTFTVCDKKPEKHWAYDTIESNPVSLQLTRLEQYRGNNCTEILQMSNFPQKTYLSSNGFVHTIVKAYNQHHNLIVRPDDVWAAIMTQFSFYINKHAEKFREKFVNFEGKKKLTVSVAGSLRNASYDELTRLMTEKIHENLVDPRFKQWILPNFTTTTKNDIVTVGVAFMATMKKYFDYGFMIMCGIPQITLEGTIQDWQNVYDRLEKLKEYNLQKWYDRLEPVVKQFVNAKQGKVDKDFWQRIVHYQRGGSGPSYISGWITVFCAFDQDGNWQGSKIRGIAQKKVHKKTWLEKFIGPVNIVSMLSISPTQAWCRPENQHLILKASRKQALLGQESKQHWWERGSRQLEWLKIETDDIPTGIVEVDVEINDNGAKYKSVMMAGHMGAEIKNGGDTVKPTLGWAIALKPESAGN